jgi:hypothetical protein
MRNSRPSCFGSAYCGTKQEAIMRNSIGPPVLFHAYSTVQLCSYAAAYGSRESCFLRMHAAHTVVRLWLALPRLRPRRRGRHGRWGPQLKWASSTSRVSESAKQPPAGTHSSSSQAATRPRLYSGRKKSEPRGIRAGARARAAGARGGIQPVPVRTVLFVQRVQPDRSRPSFRR